MTFQITESMKVGWRLWVCQLVAVEPCVAVHACLLRRDLLLGRRLIISAVCLREKCCRHDTFLITNGSDTTYFTNVAMLCTA